MKRYTGIKKADILFIVLQAILYITFLTLDLNEGSVTLSKWIKYSIIILCFCYALFFGKSVDKGITFCIKGALLFTLISDLFILILDYYVVGVLTFIIAQQLYGVRISLAKVGVMASTGVLRERKVNLAKRLVFRVSFQMIITIVIALLLKSISVKLDLLLIASIFYFISISSNVFAALRILAHNRYDRSIALFAIGMGLFLLCDINVGLFNLSGFINLQEDIYHKIYSISSVLMWTFYAPSQVLIALSTTKE